MLIYLSKSSLTSFVAVYFAWFSSSSDENPKLMASIKPSRAYKRVLFISKSTSMINFWFKRHNFYALDGAWADLFWSKNNKKILITVMIDIDSRLYTNTSFTSMGIKIKTWLQYSLPAIYITTENAKRAIFVLISISS